MMSKEKRRVPKLRFPGFTEDWEQRKLGSIGSTYTGLSGKIKEDFGHGEAQYITYLNVFQNTVSDITMTDKVEIDTTQNEVKYGDVLFTTSSETPEEVGMSSVWLGDSPNTYLNSFCFGFRPNQKIDPYFLGYSLRAPYMRDKIKILAQGISRYNISKNKVMELEISLPNNEEQKLLGTFLQRIDLIITLHQRKLDNLKLKKKALLQKLFPKNGEQYPELRFPGFTDVWEQRKLESLFTKYEDKISTPDSGYWRLGLRSHCKGTFHTYVDAGHELETTEMYRVKAGNFILNITFAWERALAVTDDEDQGKLVSHRFPQFKPNDDLVIDFFKHTLMDKRFKHHLELSSPGGAGRNKVLKVSDMLKYELLVPSIQEQNIISSFLNNVDYIITLHQRKLDHLKLQKKALLQQMFV